MEATALAGEDDTRGAPLRPGHEGWPTAPPSEWPSEPPVAWPTGAPRGTGPGGTPPDRDPGRRPLGLLGLVVALVVVALVGGAALVVLGGRGGDDATAPDRPADEPLDDDPGSDPTDGSSAPPTGGPATDAAAPPPAGAAWSVEADTVSTLVGSAEVVYAHDRRRSITAYGAASGEVLWERPIDGELQALAPLDRGQVLVADAEGGGRVTLVDAATGDEVWSIDGRPALTYKWISYGAESAERTSDVVLVTDDDDADTVAAIDRATGEAVWEVPGDEAVLCGDVVAVMEIAGDDAVDLVATTVGRGAADGSERWRLPGVPGACRGDELGVMGPGSASVVGIDGRTRTTIPAEVIDGFDLLFMTGLGVGVVPLGDHVVVPLAGEDLGVGLYPRAGGEPVWTGAATPLPAPFAGHVLVLGDPADLVSLAADGTASEPLGLVGEGCGPGVAPAAVVTCEGTEVVTRSVATLDAEDRCDVGAPVEQVTVAGERIVVWAGGRITALG